MAAQELKVLLSGPHHGPQLVQGGLDRLQGLLLEVQAVVLFLEPSTTTIGGVV